MSCKISETWVGQKSISDQAVCDMQRILYLQGYIDSFLHICLFFGSFWLLFKELGNSLVKSENIATHFIVPVVLGVLWGEILSGYFFVNVKIFLCVVSTLFCFTKEEGIHEKHANIAMFVRQPFVFAVSIFPFSMFTDLYFSQGSS